MLEDDETQAIAEEFTMQQTLGWQRRRTWLGLLLQEKGAPLMRGTIDNERKRAQHEGWCQALEFILARDEQIAVAWQEAQQAGSEPAEQLEGGDYGVHYEAAQ